RGKTEPLSKRHSGPSALRRRKFSAALGQRLWPTCRMGANTTQARRPDNVKQFSVFTANRLGKLHDLIGLLGSHAVHVLALTVIDTTDSAIVRLVVDDPEKARRLLTTQSFAFTESDLLVVELAAVTGLGGLMSALLEAELNINYLYSFILHPEGKSMLSLSMED